LLSGKERLLEIFDFCQQAFFYQMLGDKMPSSGDIFNVMIESVFITFVIKNHDNTMRLAPGP
jgi:hypothetical protein